jgi:hypothetical protein
MQKSPESLYTHLKRMAHDKETFSLLEAFTIQDINIKGKPGKVK